jgi:hypothetical protein
MGIRRVTLAVMALLVRVTAVQAHSASDAYLNLTLNDGAGPGSVVLHGQWDIALRDLDFVLQLDDDGDGKLAWGEVRRHLGAIERYAYASLHFDGGVGNACAVKPTRHMIDAHADGAYVALFFDLVCSRAPVKLRLRYNLFFAIDPSHRGIFLMQRGADTATAVLSPVNSSIELTR